MAAAALRSLPHLCYALAFQIKADLCVDAIVADFSVVHFSRELLDVERTNIPQRLGCFLCRGLRGVFPSLRRLGHQLDDFNDFGHDDNSPSSNYRRSVLRRELENAIEMLH